MTIVFNSDRQVGSSESAYAQWLLNHPGGFVVNLRKLANGSPIKSDKDKTCIHRACCSCISPPKTGFTTGEYQKICSSSFVKAETLAKCMTGLDKIKCCSFCFNDR
ncbi:hypothetical protein CSN65_004043 [Salmonella enterica subsp. diarizonae]|nr:hypothetical protein [Salmonella enterica subsp. diarizonae]